MRHAPDSQNIEADLFNFFCTELPALAHAGQLVRDSQWTNQILQALSQLGHQQGFLVFSSQTRCPTADGPEWLYDQHWRVVSEESPLVRIPLAMEIEWGYGAATIKDKITEDFLKLTQARADIRVMVFQCTDAPAMTDYLIDLADKFEGAQQGDRWFFAGWGWDTNQMHCRFYSA